MLDANVVGEAVAGGFERVISVKRGCGHEEKFDPLSALLEAGEFFPVVHLILF